MNELSVSVLGIAATLAVAAIAGLFKMIKLILDEAAMQNEYRHKLRDELTSIVLNSENRCVRRIERLELHSIGLRQARDGAEYGGDGE